MGFRAIAARVAALFFPNRCLSCHQIITTDTVFCTACERRYSRERRERFFPLHIRRDEHRQLSCFTAAVYAGGLKQSIARLKFHGRTGYARSFAKLMISSELDFSRFDVVTCVPMTEKARRKRGYNQSELLGKELAKLVSLPYEPLLKKVKENRRQRSLTKKERMYNVQDVYESSGDIMDRQILLVDDILTTGATLSECAAVLYRAGAGYVYGLCAVNTQEIRGE